jgi:O-antigen/teichoic acid export membrane protein
MLMLGLVVAIAISMGGQLIFAYILPNSTLSFYPYGLIAAGVGIFQAIFKVHGNLLQTREKPETFFWSNVSSFGVIAITTIVGLKLFPGTLIGPLGGRLLAAFLSASWALTRVFREFGVHLQSPWKDTSRSFNAYTFFYQLQQWVINYVDRFIILFFMPVAAISTVGIYEFAIKCLAPVELLMSGLNASMFPQVVKRINGQEGAKSSSPEINRYFYGQISVIMLAICCSIIFLPWVVDWFIQKSNYKEALRYVPYLAIIFILRSMRLYFVLPYNVLKKMKQLTMLNFFVSLFKIGLMIVLVIKWQIFWVIV